jgi:hypothetical protein
MLTPPHIHRGPATCAHAGNLGGVVLFGESVEVPEERWLETQVSKQMWCTCSTSPIWISPIVEAWAVGRKVKATGNVMVQILRIPLDVLHECMPAVEFQKLVGLQQEYERSVLETQQKKIAAAKRELLKAPSSVSMSKSRAMLEEKLESQQQRLRDLLVERGASRQRLTVWTAKTYPPRSGLALG